MSEYIDRKPGYIGPMEERELFRCGQINCVVASASRHVAEFVIEFKRTFANQAAKSSYKIKFEHVANYQVFSRNCFLRERSEKCI